MILLLTNPYTITFTALLLATLYTLYRKLYPTPLPGIPYNKDALNHLFGDVGLLKTKGRETMELSPIIFSLTKDLNTPVAQMLFTSFAKPYVIIDDPREAEDIIMRRGGEFDRSTLTTSLFKPLLPKSTLAQLTTPALKVQKRLWSDAMGADFLKRVVAKNILSSAMDLVELWTIKAGDGDKSFEPAYDFECTALDAIWTAVLGSKIGVVRREITKIQTSTGDISSSDGLSSAAMVQAAMAYMNSIVSTANNSVVPFLPTLLLQLTPAHRRFTKTTYSEISRLMQNACDRFKITTTTIDEELETCAMDLVLRREILTAKKAGLPPPNPSKDPAMIQELLLLLLGGHDSTTNTLSWFVKFAAMYPTCTEKLRQALRTSLGGKSINNLTASEIMDTDIPYLDAYVEELVRFSVTAGVLTRQAVVDTTVLGCFIPKGTHLIMNTRLGPEHVVREVEEGRRSATSRAAKGRRGPGLEGGSGRGLDVFEPGRWLVKSEGLEGERGVFNGSALPSLGFGGGLRGCFGKRLAVMELRIMVAVLVLGFEFLPLEDEKLNSMAGEERIFRRPQVCHVRLKAL